MEIEKGLDPELWHACAGSMVQLPPLNTKVFYFPQGHAEHATNTVNFGRAAVPPLILCRVSAVNYLADPETDEVYAKLQLQPLPNSELDLENDLLLNFDGISTNSSEKPAAFFAKTLTQSDANNGGGFSVPRYCAETIFPKLDYNTDPPVQTVIAKDVHGELWKFRHIYRGTPRRHLLTTGWSSFVNRKKLVAGDSIVFFRADNGDLCVGIRRAKRVGPNESPLTGWNSSCVNNPYGGGGSLRGYLKAKPENVVEAVTLASRGQAFDIFYYPRACTPEFCVKAALVKTAMKIRWCSGMRFKMPFETEDSSRISWFMGTVSSVQVSDAIRWPNSPWRLLQVTWDEPDLLQNVKRVNPWLVELVSNIPPVHISTFSARKKLRIPQHFEDDGQFPIPSFFSGNPLRPSSFSCFNTAAGIQGARHAHFGKSSSDLQLSNIKPQRFEFDPQSRISNGFSTNSNENLSCLLTMGNSNSNSTQEKTVNVKKHHFFLFGKPIFTEQQISKSYSIGTVSQVLNSEKANNLSAGSGSSVDQQVSPEKSFNSEFSRHRGFPIVEPTLGTGQCKVFMESEDVGRTLDLTVLRSYDELYRQLANMFGVEKSEMLTHIVFYRDGTGGVKRIGEEPFCDFMKAAKRLSIVRNSGSDSIGRVWMRGMVNGERGLDASTRNTGPLSISA